MFLATLTVACALVGFDDLFGPSELSVRVTAALLILAAVVMGVGAVALFRPWGIRELLGFLATVVAGLVLLLLALTNMSQPAAPRGPAVVGWVGVAVAVVLAARLWREGRLHVSGVFARGAPRAIVTFIGAGTVVGFGQFWYQNIYLPSVAHPAVNLSADLVTGKGFARHRRVVYVTLTMKNPTEREVTVLASHFEVLGRRLEKRRKGLQPVPRVLLERDRPMGRQVRTGRRTVLRSGEIVGTSWFLVPDEEISRRIAVSVPRRHRLIELNGYVIVARDRLAPDRLEATAGVPHDDPRSIHQEFDIVEDSAWRTLTRGHRELYTMETPGAGSVGYYGCRGYPQVQAYIDRAGHPPRRCRTGPAVRPRPTSPTSTALRRLRPTPSSSCPTSSPETLVACRRIASRRTSTRRSRSCGGSSARRAATPSGGRGSSRCAASGSSRATSTRR
jgi:hypothetical protein